MRILATSRPVARSPFIPGWTCARLMDSSSGSLTGSFWRTERHPEFWLHTGRVPTSTSACRYTWSTIWKMKQSFFQSAALSFGCCRNTNQTISERPVPSIEHIPRGRIPGRDDRQSSWTRKHRFSVLLVICRLGGLCSGWSRCVNEPAIRVRATMRCPQPEFAVRPL
jgi:hypothetical protein